MDKDKFTSVTIDIITHKRLKVLGCFNNISMAQIIKKLVDDNITRLGIKDEIDGLIR